MKYNVLGNTGLKVSELCLGTMTLGGRGMWTAIGTLPQDQVNTLVKQSVDGGIIEEIEVGIEMSGGPGTASARFAMNVLEYYK